MEITSEQVYEWRTNPVTRFYLNKLQELADQENRIDILDYRLPAEELGVAAIGRINYVAGIMDAANVETILEVIDE